MLGNIKLEYFVKTLFSFINEGIKLKLLNYNKNLQNKLEIGLINYKLYSGKYIIIDSNGKGKEYKADNDIVLFEGEYLKGKRNGKGKEYDDCGPDYLIFEGEYSNGKRNGKGKQYDLDGHLVFEGEYLNGKRWNGKGYDADGNIVYELKNGNGYVKKFSGGKLRYEGEYLNGGLNGKVKKYNLNKEIIFEGNYLNGKKNGKAKEYLFWNCKLHFEGEYFNGKRWNGKEYDTVDNNIIYEIRNGKGFLKEYSMLGPLFEGEYVSGERNGKGKEYDRGTLMYEGEFLNEKKVGKEKNMIIMGK